MTTTSQTKIADAIANLDSSLKNRILMSGAFRVGGRAISLVEKLNRLDLAEAKYGRRKIDPQSGQPECDTLRANLEEVLACYGAIMDCGGDSLAVVASLEALVASREQPYVRILSNEQLELRAKLSGQSIHTIQKQQYAAAESKANAFSAKAGNILGELESALAFAPNYELMDIPVETWEMKETIEQAIKKYKAAVATGKVWDDTDMILAQGDIETLEVL